MDPHQNPLPPNLKVPARVQVKRGELVVHDGRAARVIAIESPTKIMLGIVGTQQILWVGASELSRYCQDRVSVAADRSVCDLPSDDALERAEAWVREFARSAERGFLVYRDQLQIAQRMDVSVRTVARRFDTFRDDPSPAAQLRLKPGPKAGVKTLPPAVEALIEKVIDEMYESEERPTVQAATEEVSRQFKNLGLHGRPPSYSSVRSRVRDRSQWKSQRKRHGRVRGDAMAGPAGPLTKKYKPLDLVQIDHAIVDLILVDPDTREEIGRPWITLAIDVGTRVILGFYLTFDDPSQTSVALCLEHCCFPKDTWLKSIGYEGEWRPFGLMKSVGWDNAKCFKPTSLRQALRAQGVEVRFRRIRTPTHGAHIERYIGTYMGKIHLLKGTTFSNTKEREDYDSQKRAVMSLKELTLWSVHQINGVYHNQKHDGLGCTPLQAWDREWIDVNGRCLIPPFPEDQRDFRLSMLPGKYRSIGREGIQLFSLKYWDDFLTPLMGHKEQVWVAFDPRNISVVFLKYGDRFIDIAWRDRTRRPCALFELKAAKERVKACGGDTRRESEIFFHMNKMREIEEAAEQLTRTQRRNKARRPPESRPKVIREEVIDYQNACITSLDPLDALT